MGEIDGLLEDFRRARRQGRPEEGYRIVAEAMSLSRRSGDRRDLVRALKARGQLDRDLGDREGALAHYEEATALCREDDDALMLAHTVRHVGDILYELGRTGSAERCYVEALDLYRPNPETHALDLANAVRPLAILRAETGEVDEAVRLWTEARDLYATLGIAAGVAEGEAWLSRLT